jgi:hypothetical protein
MKRKRAWKFSLGGGALFTAFLVGPLVIQLLLITLGSRPLGWTNVVALGFALFLGALIWFVSLRPLIREGSWRLARSWCEASFALSVLYLFYAVWIFVTGYTPTKYNSRPIPREYGFTWLFFAIVPFTVSIVAYLREKNKTPN